MEMNPSDSTRRTGDEVAISGDYQYKALHHGPAPQRFWHYTKQLIITELLTPEQTDTVLDVGCGSGVVSDFLANTASRVVGLDGSEEAIGFAGKQFSRPNLSFRRELVDDNFTMDEPVDKIYCMELIEHIYNPQAVTMLRHFYNLLKPGGKVLLTTPNYRSLWPVIEFLLDRSGLTPPLMDDQHVCFYHGAMLRETLRKAGFEVVTSTRFCLAAPWLAGLSWSLSEAVFKMERALGTPGGLLLVAVAQKPLAPPATSSES